MKTVVVVPGGNSREKNDAMRALGAELIEHGEDFHDADRHAKELALRRKLWFVPAFDLLLVRGVATYALELFAAVSDLDFVYVPIGWGSGACGLAAARNALKLKTRIVRVVSSQAPSYARSIAANELIEIPPQTRIADGIAIARPHADAFELVRDQIERVVEVSDEAVEKAMRTYFKCAHSVAEGAGAASLAAVFQERERIAVLILAIFLLAALAITRLGLMPVSADGPHSKLEARIMPAVLHASIVRHASGETNPVPLNEDNLKAGIDTYKTMCASATARPVATQVFTVNRSTRRRHNFRQECTHTRMRSSSG